MLTGRKFLYAMSRPHFFNVGNTRAYLHSSANRPDSNDTLIIQVITGNSTSRTCRTTGVGAGSKGQGFMAAFPIIKEKWSCVKVLKFGNSAHSRASGSTQSAHVPMLSAEASSSPSINVAHRLFVLLFLLWFYPGSGGTPLYNPYRYMCRPKG